MGKVACKASTEIGHCAWRMIGRQSTNNSKSVIIFFLFDGVDDHNLVLILMC